MESYEFDSDKDSVPEGYVAAQKRGKAWEKRQPL